MNPAYLDILEGIVKGTVILGFFWVMLRKFGGPILTNSVREALAPELERLEGIEREIQGIREALETKRQRIGDMDRRIGHHDTALAQLPSIRTSLDFLTAEMGRSNSLNERGMSMIQDLAIQVGRLQGEVGHVRRAAPGS